MFFGRTPGPEGPHRVTSAVAVRTVRWATAITRYLHRLECELRQISDEQIGELMTSNELTPVFLKMELLLQVWRNRTSERADRLAAFIQSMDDLLINATSVDEVRNRFEEFKRTVRAGGGKPGVLRLVVRPRF